MAGYRLVPAAEADIESVLVYTLHEYGLDKYHDYATLIEEALAALATDPGVGQRREYVHPDARTYRIAKPGRDLTQGELDLSHRRGATIGPAAVGANRGVSSLVRRARAPERESRREWAYPSNAPQAREQTIHEELHHQHWPPRHEVRKTR